MMQLSCTAPELWTLSLLYGSCKAAVLQPTAVQRETPAVHRCERLAHRAARVGGLRGGSGALDIRCATECSRSIRKRVAVCCDLPRSWACGCQECGETTTHGRRTFLDTEVPRDLVLTSGSKLHGAEERDCH
jgi:hypothetical protein